MGEALLPRAEVERRVGFKRSAIYARIAAGKFPAPLRDPETGAVRWLESEITDWIATAAATWPRSPAVGTVVGTGVAEPAQAA